ncbi:MAG: tRNA (adenosine(37)-N6)-threonylcarbamoyltransferase complex ATPase subunit type 1 TsaE [Planctomycetaceae bacterium]|nr:MAG: tRNA (adenosine(37)-N6)-threonylcarbamoyltransferase complex ATPase subunit type 1 TsaE [Planctomycetaceae bacterium]
MNGWLVRHVDLADLQRIAEALHATLPEHAVIGLRGSLGAGKTRFAQCFAVAIGIDATDVTSPTFGIVHHHHGARRLHHIDAYRLADEDEFIELGGEELLEEESAVVLIEWPERIVGCLPPGCWMIDLEIESSGEASGQARMSVAADPAEGDFGGLELGSMPSGGTRQVRFSVPDAAMSQALRESVARLLGRSPENDRDGAVAERADGDLTGVERADGDGVVREENG